MASDFISNLKNRIQKSKNTTSGLITFSSNNDKNLRLGKCTIEDIMPHLLIYSSLATIDSKEKMWIATSMLVRLLESFTNNLVVMESEIPIGMLGSQEVLHGLYHEPVSEFFSKRTVKNVMSKDLCVIFPNTKVSDMLNAMKKSGRDFALVQNQEGEFSTISARRLLEVGMLCDTQMKVSDMPPKKITTFTKNDTITTIIEKMLTHRTDVLILENTPLFINSQTILEKTSELNYLEATDEFLEAKASSLNLRNGRIIPDNTTIPEVCKIMLGMKHSFIMTQNNVVTPWDLISVLS